MKAIMSALGKSLFTVMLAVSLVAASCNTSNSRSKEVRVKDNGKDMKVQERTKNDTVNIKREQSVNRDENGNSKSVIKEEKKVDNSSTNPNTNRNR